MSRPDSDSWWDRPVTHRTAAVFIIGYAFLGPVIYAVIKAVWSVL